MDAFLKTLQTLPEVAELVSRVENGGCPAVLTGTQPVQRACVGAAVAAGAGRPMVFLCGAAREARPLAGALQSLTGETPVTLLAREWQFRPNAVSSREWERSRLAALHQMAAGNAPIVVATVDALLARTMPPHRLAELSVTLETGGRADLKELCDRLLQAGYSRCDQVEGVGQFALRGGILDVFSPLMEQPVRCEFFDDEIDSLGLFDPGTQRRTENVSAALLLPAAEVLPGLTPGGLTHLAEQIEKLAVKYAKKENGEKIAQTLRGDAERFRNGAEVNGLDRYLGLIYPDAAGGADYLPPDACVLFSESSRVGERAKTYQWQLEEDAKSLMERGELDGSCAVLSRTFPELNARLSDWPTAYLDSFTLSAYPVPPGCLLSVTAKQLPSFGASLETAVSDLDHYQRSGLGTLVLVSSEQRALNLQTLLREQGLRAAVEFQPQTLPGPGETLVSVGGLSAGMEYPEARLAVLTEGQGAALKKPRPRKAATNREKLKSYADLSPGDLVVHEHHGVGRYMGMVKLPADGVEKDYVKIAYAGSDVLYVPATQLDLVSKYIGGGEDAAETKKLSRLGGTDWEKAKSKAKKAVKDLAKGLIQLYAQRQRQPGFAFSPDSPWQREFEEEFEYAETEDQLRCVEEIKRDMERPVPMDRLLCGDVGYGKTEVAFRAVMKSVLDGKQAAVLVPTTVLARQHFLNALRRFAKYPVTIDVVSRFRTSAQMKQTLRRVESGEVDILIGTHRLFNRDVRFKDLGLLVVDEQQRFGVDQRAKLLEKGEAPDALYLTATPIPRTLALALYGNLTLSYIKHRPHDSARRTTRVLSREQQGDAFEAAREALDRGE